MVVNVFRMAMEDSLVNVLLDTLVNDVKIVSDSISNGSICNEFRTKKCNLIVLGDACTPSPCLNGATCIPNGFGGFTCQCQPGFSGQRCEDRKILEYLSVACFYHFYFYQVILVPLNLERIKAHACEIMADSVVCAHQVLLELDVKFAMDVKVILA